MCFWTNHRLQATEQWQHDETLCTCKLNSRLHQNIVERKEENKNVYECATYHTLASSSARDVGSSCPPLFPTFLNDMLALSVPLQPSPSSSEPHPITKTAISPPKTTQHKNRANNPQAVQTVSTQNLNILQGRIFTHLANLASWLRATRWVRGSLRRAHIPWRLPI